MENDGGGMTEITERKLGIRESQNRAKQKQKEKGKKLIGKENIILKTTKQDRKKKEKERKEGC